MKKTLLLFSVLLLCSGVSRSQFNHSFVPSEKIRSVTGYPNGDVVTWSEFGIRRYDASGALLWERHYDLTGSNPYAYLATRNSMVLISATDGGTVCGRMMITQIAGTNNYTYQPFIYKLDVNGNLVWSHCYDQYTSLPFRLSQEDFPITGIRMESKEKQEDRFMFTYPGAIPPRYPMTNPLNSGVGVLIVNGATGSVGGIRRIFHSDSAQYMYWHSPEAISYAGTDSDGGDLYMILGKRADSDVPHPTASNYFQFRMLVNSSGLKVGNTVSYQSYNPGAVNIEQFNYSATYDKSGKSVLLSFTQFHSNIYNGLSQLAAIGIQSIDLSLNTRWSNLYWTPNGHFNSAYNIQSTHNTRNEFVVSGNWANYDHTWGSSPNVQGTEHLLKIDHRGKPVFYRHYQTSEINNLLMPARGLAVTSTPSTENYTFPASIGNSIANPVVGQFERLLSTDVNGDVCGSVDERIEVGRLPENAPVIETYLEAYDDYIMPIRMADLPTNLDFDDCAFRRGIAGKSLNVMQPAQSEMKVYPTLIGATDKAELTVEFGSNEGSVTLNVISVDGRMTSKQKLTVGAASKTEKIDVGNLQPGTYFLNIVSGDGKLNRSFRFTKL